MANQFTATDLKKGLIHRTVICLLDWSATGVTTILDSGDHPKMRLDHVYVDNKGAALNATEPIINIRHGISTHEVVETVDMATGLGATAAIGVMAELTIIEGYRYLEEDEAAVVQVETANGAGISKGLLTLEYTAVAE